jgi:hypothetical protein
MSDDNWILGTLAPKSDQLNADDLSASPITVRVVGVKQYDNDKQPCGVELEGYDGRPWKPCKGMRRALVQFWGPSVKQWIGRRITLFRNPKVRYSGKEAGGIQFSGMSHIADKQQVPGYLQGTITVAADGHYVTMITASRGVREEMHVWPLPDEPEQKPVDLIEKFASAKKAIAEADSLEKLGKIESAAKSMFSAEQVKELAGLIRDRTGVLNAGGGNGK